MTKDIQNALEMLKKGGVILFPTDTHWSLGCDATNPAAVEKLFQIKRKPAGGNALVLMENPALLDRYVRNVPEIAWDLVEISTTPLTLVFPETVNLAPGLTAHVANTGFRFTREEFSAELIRRFRRPVLASSANISGNPAPSNFSEIITEIKQAADYIVEYRQADLETVRPSSIISLDESGRIDIVRE